MFVWKYKNLDSYNAIEQTNKFNTKNMFFLCVQMSIYLEMNYLRRIFSVFFPFTECLFFKTVCRVPVDLSINFNFQHARTTLISSRLFAFLSSTRMYFTRTSSIQNSAHIGENS